MYGGTDEVDITPNFIETVREYAMIGVCLLLGCTLAYSSVRLCRSQRAKFTFDAIILLIQMVVCGALIVYEVKYVHLLLLLGIQLA